MVLPANARASAERLRDHVTHVVRDFNPRDRSHGYSLQAGRRVHENDRVGLEELARYGLRPALSQERLREAEDGMVLSRDEAAVLR